MLLIAAALALGGCARSSSPPSNGMRAKSPSNACTAEAELRRKLSGRVALFDRMVEGIISWAQPAIRLANRAAGEFFGFTPPAADRTVLEATRHHEVCRAGRAARHRGGGAQSRNYASTVCRRPAIFRSTRSRCRDSEGARDGAILVFTISPAIRQLEAVRQDFGRERESRAAHPVSLIKSAAET